MILTSWLAQTISAFALNPFFGPPPGYPGGPIAPRQPWNRRQMYLLLWKLRRAYTLAVGEHGLEEIGAAVGRLANAGIDATEAVLAWVDLMETVVQEIEAEYGTKAGAGAEKKAAAKAILVALISRSNLAKRAPDVFTPLVIWAAADLLVDAVVRIINDHDLWDMTGSSPTVPDTGASLVRRIAVWVLNLLAYLYTRQLRSVSLSPRVQASLDRVIARHPIDPIKLVDGAWEIVTWLSDHRAEIYAVLDVVSAAAAQAEIFGSLSGPEKRRYVHDLIVTFVDIEFGSGFAALLDSPLGATILDTAIDGVVLILRKRGVFRPEQIRTPPGQALGLRHEALLNEGKPAMQRRRATVAA